MTYRDLLRGEISRCFVWNETQQLIPNQATFSIRPCLDPSMLKLLVSLTEMASQNPNIGFNRATMTFTVPDKVLETDIPGDADFMSYVCQGLYLLKKNPELVEPTSFLMSLLP